MLLDIKWYRPFPPCQCSQTLPWSCWHLPHAASSHHPHGTNQILHCHPGHNSFIHPTISLNWRMQKQTAPHTPGENKLVDPLCQRLWWSLPQHLRHISTPALISNLPQWLICPSSSRSWTRWCWRWWTRSRRPPSPPWRSPCPGHSRSSCRRDIIKSQVGPWMNISEKRSPWYCSHPSVLSCYLKQVVYIQQQGNEVPCVYFLTETV